MSDRKLRELERLAAGGDLEHVKALAYARFRAGVLVPSFGGELWIVRFARLNNDLVVYSAVSEVDKQPYFADIPTFVMDVIGASASASLRPLRQIEDVVTRAAAVPEEWVTQPPPRLVGILPPDVRGHPGLAVEIVRHCCAPPSCTPPRDPAHLDIDGDDTGYMGDGDNGVYYGVAPFDEGSLRSMWWALNVVDTPGFTHDITVGVYDTRMAALDAARAAALDWIIDNDVEI